MKKTVIGLFASLALVLGIGAMGSSATAAPSPYPSSVRTDVFITRTAPVTEGKTFTTRVVVFAGNAVVDEGTVTVVFGGRKFSAPVSGGEAILSVKAPSVNKSKYKNMTARYQREGGSVYKSSTTSTRIYVKNKK